MIRIAGLVAIATVLGSTVSAERLAVRRYTTADGLTGDFIIPPLPRLARVPLVLDARRV
jgi:hypothetical protein